MREVALGLDEFKGPIYSASMAVPRPRIRSPANRHSVAVRATWRRRELEDALVDGSELLQGQVASGRGSGGADMSRGCRAAMAASSWLAGDVARACLACCGEEGSEQRGSTERAKPGARHVGLGAARAIRVLCSRPEHARNMLDGMPLHARGLG